MSKTYKNNFRISDDEHFPPGTPKNKILRALHKHYGPRKTPKWFQAYKETDKQAVRAQHKRELIKVKKDADYDVDLRSKVIDTWYYD